MPAWTETYRGVVSAWECDIVEHFTIAYYFERFADATRTFIELIGERESLGSAVQSGPARLFTTFQQELRAGAAFHMQSAVVRLDGDTLHLGHQVIDSTSGKTGTWVSETVALPAALPQATRRKLEGLAVAWPGPAVAEVKPEKAGAPMLTARDRVKPWELDERGRLSLSDHVHRFSGAGMQFLTSLGLTGEFMHKNRRGFSTFLLDTHLVGAAGLGERVDVQTAVAHLGNTSLRYVHRMTGADGRLLATIAQAGVLLDLDARRPTAIPAEIRQRITDALAGG